MQKSTSLITTTHELLAKHLQPGDIAIDATLGNGYDTLFLAQHVGPEGKVFGFDIQSAALQSTQEKCQRAQLQERVRLIQDNHANMPQHIPDSLHGRINAIMFNLGYLPGGDKTIITQCDSTLIALNAAIDLLSPTGMLTLVAYPGHQGGDQETEQVTHWCEQLNTAHFKVKIYYSAINKDSAPRLFVIKKIQS